MDARIPAETRAEVVGDTIPQLVDGVAADEDDRAAAKSGARHP